MIVALWAALAMVLQDILAVVMVQSENRKRGWTAGCLDAAAWLCALVTNHFALNAMNTKGRVGLEIAVVLAVTAANIIGSKLGTWMGDRLFPNPMEARLEKIEATLAGLSRNPLTDTGINGAPCCQSGGCCCQ